MLFHSIEFLVFFPIAVALYYACPARRRWVPLLAASYYFYMCWKPAYVVLIIVSTLIDYLAGLGMGRASSSGQRRWLLVASLAGNLSILCSFKYFNFFSRSLSSALDHFGLAIHSPLLDVLLPVGVSFYTFQSISYTVDVYRRAREPERHLGWFALYVAYFPQLVAGPIERSTHLLPQLHAPHGFDMSRTVSGIQRMLWGYFKKLVIADRLAIVADAVYGQPAGFCGASLLVATYCFAIQIYCDFAGYTDIAIGAARIMGVDLMDNFNRPYCARSFRDFWHRWHISLSTWFRDYLYIPLGGSRAGTARGMFNIVIVFLLAGLWHGANWTFAAWGALHAAYLLAERAVAKVASRIHVSASGLGAHMWPGLQRLFVFHAVAAGWVFFRATSLADALLILKRIVTWSGGTQAQPLMPGLGPWGIATAIASVAALIAVEALDSRTSIRARVDRCPWWLQWGVSYALAATVLVLGVHGRRAFLYFQF